MIAVLMSSRRQGSSSWSAVRGRKKVSISGLSEGDLLRIVLSDGVDHHLNHGVQEDTVIEIPDWCVRVMAEHIEISGSPVYVDLR